jgi:DNA-binding transcriptional MerR regulator
VRQNPQLRPIDLAREHGLSTQAIRNYEADGILPAASRTASGYRAYTPRHAQALTAFLALLPGHGHRTATAIMRAVNQGGDPFRLIDESHALLLEDRRTLRAVEAGLGLRPATLRKWERAGLIQPRRERQTGYRVFGPADVRDAQLVHQLRRGGYRLQQIAPLIEQVRAAGGVEPLESMLDHWRARLTARGRAMVSGAAALDAYLSFR